MSKEEILALDDDIAYKVVISGYDMYGTGAYIKRSLEMMEEVARKHNRDLDYALFWGATKTKDADSTILKEIEKHGKEENAA